MSDVFCDNQWAFSNGWFMVGASESFLIMALGHKPSYRTVVVHVHLEK